MQESSSYAPYLLHFLMSCSPNQIWNPYRTTVHTLRISDHTSNLISSTERRLRAQLRGQPHCGPNGPQKHKDGSKAQDKEDSRNHGLQDPYVPVPYTMYHIPNTVYHGIRDFWRLSREPGQRSWQARPWPPARR